MWYVNKPLQINLIKILYKMIDQTIAVRPTM